MKSSVFHFIATCILTTGLFSCKTQSKTTAPAPAVTVNCEGTNPTYDSDVKPILDAHCASSCHSAKSKASGIDLSTYENARAISSKKKFLGSIRHEKGFEAMPRKNPKLSEEDILKIACWVQGGSVR